MNPSIQPEAAMDERGQHGDANATDDHVRKITGFRWFLICAGLYLSALMYGLDTTIAADVQGAVMKTFHEVSQLAWIGASFPVGSVAVILPYGFLYFNMKWLYIGGIVLFQAGSALCGAASTMNALIVGRIGATVICLVIASQAFRSTAVRNLNDVLAGQGFSQTEMHNTVAGAQSTLFETLSGGLREAVIGAITSAMQRTFIIPLVAAWWAS
ncbi:MFS drug efflux transporter [Tolypocladium paradoxum]|uniref:MFS drug efflux transporter n=1 Tax=Tolypocladium paradoxum TaxID=94208 RepID=A0A2S4KTJ2_9HYPO|nr:MFS drug efflux transporter [Tolypocladium paradoxum]